MSWGRDLYSPSGEQVKKDTVLRHGRLSAALRSAPPTAARAPRIGSRAAGGGVRAAAAGGAGRVREVRATKGRGQG